jgi:hypothetical protein
MAPLDRGGSVSIDIRLAATAADMELIRCMNNDVFACEVGQHEPAPDGRLIDPLETRSRFLVGIEDGSLIAMVSFHSEPPYSVEKKLSDPEVLKALSAPVFEIRLLAVHPAHRSTNLLARLLVRLHGLLTAAGARTLVISALALRLPMYEFMGFRALGPAVQSGGAAFVPMALDMAGLPPRAKALCARYALGPDS